MSEPLIGILVSVLVAFGIAQIAVSTRRLKQLDVSLIQLYTGAISTLMLFLYLGTDGIIAGKIPFTGITW